VSDRSRRHFAFVRLLSSAVVNQALLSAANFAIGLILIRRTTDAQYGYYILAASAILLLVSLQNAIFKPPLAIRMQRLAPAERDALIGGLYREQRRILPILGAITLVIATILWYAQVLDTRTGPLVLATIAVALPIMHREYFRMVLFAHRRPHEVLRTDIFYVVLMVAGVYVATLTPVPAVAAVVTSGIAAMVSGVLLSRTLCRAGPLNTTGAPGILRSIAPIAMWSTAGATIHWTFSQGYIYLVAATLDVSAVAAIAATRMLMMPINLLSTGIGTLMLPLASGWLHEFGIALLLRRLCLFASGLATATLCYFTAVWLLRDWIFAVVLRKEFAQRDELLVLWGAIFLVVVIRDQLAYMLTAQERFRVLSLLTLVSAVVSLASSYLGMLRYGVAGALVGLLLGELVNITGIAVLSFRKTPHRLTAGA